MTGNISVAILDDHQSIIDGYQFRLSQALDIDVVATALFGDDLEPLLEEHSVDVLLLDINLPSSRQNPYPYPVLHQIPQLLQQFPDLNIVVITMHNERSLIRNVMQTGVSGYILKDDQSAIRRLSEIIRSIVEGGVYYSQNAHRKMIGSSHAPDAELPPRELEALSICAAYPDNTANELAVKMNVAPSTFRNLLSNAYSRLGVHSRAASIARARELGLITPHSPQSVP